ncbi:galactose-specific lectin nattectin-like [Corythoichthys intestinalis]|uniref:galactose-specific lectin nattectin-like n=1 Tax=Corythoichthys intestinalis TaxID=161448 RepID=UPI0025A6800F|nr:galactose-specific lectin nattectin-like [Corythoichthys intestinalis]XP_061802910.1 galactose-specific lectin nattectin-like [Nerophis lumbriciformis]
MDRLHLLFVLCGILALTTASRHSSKENDCNCPKGWTQLDKYCYIYQHDNRSFSDAESVCNVLGGNLVSINSRKENAIVVELIREGAGTVVDTWIGLHDAIEEGEFVWTDGEVVNFKNFGMGQPDDSGSGEDCVEIEADDEMWDDDECTDLNPYVCIRPVNKKKCH